MGSKHYRRCAFLFFSIATAATFASAKSFHPYKIIGIKPIIPVDADGSNVDTDLQGSLDAIGLISTGPASSCTGTHLGQGYVITAGHCFSISSQKAGTSAPILQGQPCPDVKVDWGYRGSPETGNPRPLITLTSQCTQIVYAENSATQDFAIFKVDVAPNTSIALSDDTESTDEGTVLTLFGYPDQNPLSWSQYCPLVSISSVPDLQQQYGNQRFLYQCDTAAGNSGSALLTIDSSGNVTLVGVHNDAAPPAYPYNVGTNIFGIRQTLLNQGFNLDQVLF